MFIFKRHKLAIFIFLLSAIGGILRFYNLNWGSPFYFHPDERNIASSVIQLSFPSQMNPHFFAYGSFPIYLIYFTGLILNSFLKFQDLFAQAILVSRFYSAILSLAIIPSVYFAGTRLHSKKVGLLTAVFCTFSVGLIQFAHFGTFEMWLTFFGIWFFYFSLKLLKSLNSKNIIAIGIIFGLLMATKVSSFPFLILPLALIALDLLPKAKIRNMHLLLLKASHRTLMLIIISLIIFIISSPYVFLDLTSFFSSIRYESSVALGILPVFYTGEFFNSIPVLFQFTKIYPFLINPLLTIIFIPSLFYLIYRGIKTKNLKYLILNTCYLILFIFQAFLFAKWTRYVVPTLPFIYLIVSIALVDFLKRKILTVKYLLLGAVIAINIIYVASYFITAFVKSDTRIDASIWAKEKIPNDSRILSEVYDLGIVPFNRYFPKITLFNFYDLESDRFKKQELYSTLPNTDYIILSSQRILETRLLNQAKFPLGNNFYKNLIDKKLSYQKIYETPCDIFCKITYLSNPVFALEQTVNVFDRPTVFIFKKI